MFRVELLWLAVNEIVGDNNIGMGTEVFDNGSVSEFHDASYTGAVPCGSGPCCAWRRAQP